MAGQGVRPAWPTSLARADPTAPGAPPGHPTAAPPSRWAIEASRLPSGLGGVRDALTI